MISGYLLDTNIAIAILIREKSVLDFIFETAQQKIPIYFGNYRVRSTEWIAF